MLDLAVRDVVPGGTQRNRAYLQRSVAWGDLSRPEQMVLADAQTSGGLLIAARDHRRLAGELDARGVRWWDIGETVDGSPGEIEIAGRLAVGGT